MKSASAHFFTQAAVWLLFGVLTNAHAHGTYHDLVAAVSAQIETEPDNAELYVKRSRLHLEHADWKAVLIDLERADRLAPGMLDADLVRGEALALAGKWQAALAVLNDLLKTHADQPQGLLQRARVLKQLKQDEPCLNDYRLALEKTSHPEPDLFNEAAEALMACGHGEEAVQVLQRGLHGQQLARLEIQFGDVGLCEGLDLPAGPPTVLPEAQQAADLFDREPEVPGPPDELQRVHVLLGVLPVACVGACGRRQQVDAFVVPDHLGRDAGGRCRFADVHECGHGCSCAME